MFDSERHFFKIININDQDFWKYLSNEIFHNLKDNNQQNQFLMDIMLHEGSHITYNDSTLSKNTEEQLVRNYQNNSKDLINFYQNSGEYQNSNLSNLTSWAYSNSSVQDQYNASNQFVNNFYNTSTQNVTELSLINNNFAAQNVNKNDIEPYQKDVHKYLTIYLAENAGFTHEESRQIANADQGVDDDNITGPFVGQRARENYHFTTVQRREEMKNIAYKTGDLKLFGEYLHALQDSYSHQVLDIPFEKKVGHLFFGTFPDLTITRPNLANDMALDTYVELQNFLNRNGVVARNTWSNVKDPVDNFNNSYLTRSKLNALKQ